MSSLYVPNFPLNSLTLLKPVMFQYPSEFSSDSFPNNRSTSTFKRHIHTTSDPQMIKDVYEDNFEEEFKKIMHLVETYKTIGMDTEFPGIVYRLSQNDLNSVSNYSEMEYRMIKMNVDRLKVIQIGISLSDEEGNLPKGVNTWQFNFKFDLNTDEHAKDAIELLSNSGIKFEEHASRGINPKHFAEYLIGSGLILNDDIKWISFHGGFDFAYIIKMLNTHDLPDTEAEFYSLLNAYFPLFYDVKYMIRDLTSIKGSSLSKIAADLSLRRVGPQHQAGSDALLTLSTYLKLKEIYFRNASDQRHGNILYGIFAHKEDSATEYGWPITDYPSMVFNGYGMGNMPMMVPPHYPTDNIAGGFYNMHYNMIYNFGSNFPSAESKSRKFDSPVGKGKGSK